MQKDESGQLGWGSGPEILSEDASLQVLCSTGPLAGAVARAGSDPTVVCGPTLCKELLPSQPFTAGLLECPPSPSCLFCLTFHKQGQP